MTTIHIRETDGRYEFRFPYSPDVIGIIKTAPAYSREWDPARKRWLIDIGPDASAVIDLLVDHGHTVVGLPEQRRTADSATWAEELLTACPPHIREQVYRALTKVLHPDAGGTTKLQQELNDARQHL
ncbi:hypothetical protein [Candidatus Mycolicibacterium alkanivorans]|uniref:Uncharacterized protein n=1 Tax=Candidatus Mycolicibacterium alkanivorans TaxID=2954114 RepID=A0ABS9YWP5_9MYCO|nr:hypothetical protein [Candidatus Mycolicibacterium alkanivorans]MCI4674784.1 hypothetical protein [Candidatus Mycolicibacterium alkanivorans]